MNMMSQKISERAVGTREMPKADREISEQFRLAGEDWADLDAAAYILKETKKSVLAEKKQKLVDEHAVRGVKLPDSHAERMVLASSDWREHVMAIAESNRKANHAWVRVEYIKMLDWERKDRNANARAEMRMTGR
jgi:hypothetical protein